MVESEAGLLDNADCRPGLVLMQSFYRIEVSRTRAASVVFLLLCGDVQLVKRWPLALVGAEDFLPL